jgi:voltage-gated potassium channel
MSQLIKTAEEVFYNVESRKFLVVNNFLAVLTLISVLAIILESITSLESYSTLFRTIEYVAVFFFTLEYIGRILVNKKDITSYAFSFFGIVDLLAIVPTFLGLSNLTFLKSARILRILRLLRVIRIAKIARFEKERTKDLEDYAHLYSLNIKIYFFALLSAIIVFGTLIYIIEGDNETFRNIPLGMIWAAKILLGGISPVVPATVVGEIISVLGRFVGLALLGLLISIVGGMVRKLLFGTKDIAPDK